MKFSQTLIGTLLFVWFLFSLFHTPYELKDKPVFLSVAQAINICCLLMVFNIEIISLFNPIVSKTQFFVFIAVILLGWYTWSTVYDIVGFFQHISIIGLIFVLIDITFFIYIFRWLTSIIAHQTTLEILLNIPVSSAYIASLLTSVWFNNG